MEKISTVNENNELKINCDKLKSEKSILIEKINNLNIQLQSKDVEIKNLSLK